MKIGLKYFAGRDRDNDVALFKVADVSEVRLCHYPNVSFIEFITKNGNKCYKNYYTPDKVETANKELKKIKNLLRIVNERW